MNRFKFLAMVEEFPFLGEILSERSYENCDGISIKRATKELFQFVPKYDGATGSLVGIDNGETFYFILEDGTVINSAVRNSGYVTHNEAYQDNESWDGETILEAIHRHQVSTILTYIVSLKYGYNITSHYSGPEYEVTIFKAAKGFTILDLVTEEITKAREEVKAEANF